MRKLNLIWIFLLLLTSLVLAEDVYVEVTLHLTPADVIATDIQLYEGLPQDYLGDYNEYYVGKVYSFGKELLYEFNFEKSFYVHHIGNIEEDDETISFPHFRNMAKLEVWDEREIKLELDLSSYASCNENSFCDTFENEINCPEDCGEDVIVVKEVIEDKEESIPIPKKEGKSKGVYYALILVIVVILLVLFLLIVSKKKQKHF